MRDSRLSTYKYNTWQVGGLRCRNSIVNKRYYVGIADFVLVYRSISNFSDVRQWTSEQMTKFWWRS